MRIFDWVVSFVLIGLMLFMFYVCGHLVNIGFIQL